MFYTSVKVCLKGEESEWGRVRIYYYFYHKCLISNYVAYPFPRFKLFFLYLRISLQYSKAVLGHPLFSRNIMCLYRAR